MYFVTLVSSLLFLMVFGFESGLENVAFCKGDIAITAEVGAFMIPGWRPWERVF